MFSALVVACLAARSAALIAPQPAHPPASSNTRARRGSAPKPSACRRPCTARRVLADDALGANDVDGALGANTLKSLDLDALVAGAGLRVAADAAADVAGLESLSEEAPPLSASALLRFERDGHLCTRSLLTDDEVAAIAEPVARIAAAEAADAVRHAEAMNDLHDGERAPFLQTFNAHRRHAAARRVASCPRLAGVAAQLLGVDRVRLYQDCIFKKRAGDEPTNWHSDLHTSPLDTNGFVTCWFPLHAVPASEAGGTGLAYASGSHRDLALPMWYGQDGDCDGRYDVVDHGAYAPGDVSWHHGWLLHSAPENVLEDRTAVAVSFFADGAHLIDEAGMLCVNDEDAPSYEAWLGDLEPGAPADHALLPVVYPA